jgi:hypothetical protein
MPSSSSAVLAARVVRNGMFRWYISQADLSISFYNSLVAEAEAMVKALSQVKQLLVLRH